MLSYFPITQASLLTHYCAIVVYQECTRVFDIYIFSENTRKHEFKIKQFDIVWKQLNRNTDQSS